MLLILNLLCFYLLFNILSCNIFAYLIYFLGGFIGFWFFVSIFLLIFFFNDILRFNRRDYKALWQKL